MNFDKVFRWCLVILIPLILIIQSIHDNTKEFSFAFLFGYITACILLYVFYYDKKIKEGGENAR